MPGIGIVTNPHSKANRSKPGNIKMLGYILGHQGRLEVTNKIEDLVGVAKRFKEQNIEILAINGGDGTISRTISAFIKTYEGSPLPKIALLRGGTMNVVAQNLGIRGSPDKILASLVELYSTGEPLKVQTLSTIKIENNYGFLFGTGVAAQFLVEYYKKKTGPLGAFLLCLSVWFSGIFDGVLFKKVIKDQLFRLTSKDFNSIVHNSICFLCSTVKRMPLSYPLFNKINGNVHKFQCVSFTLKPKEAIYKFPLILLQGKYASKTQKFEVTLQEIKLSSDNPFNYTLDGELFDPVDSITIQTGPIISFIVI
jgi:diacylglycerol kinase (ATP)